MKVLLSFGSPSMTRTIITGEHTLVIIGPSKKSPIITVSVTTFGVMTPSKVMETQPSIICGHPTMSMNSSLIPKITGFILMA